MEQQENVLCIFIALSDQLYELLPDFGKALAIDSKWVSSLANRKSNRRQPDGRSEMDAEWGTKQYSGTNAEGKEWSKALRCFGFKLHAIVDTKYELPVAFLTSGANGSDVAYGRKWLEETKKQRPHVIERCEYFLGDRGYDDTEFIKQLKAEDIKPIIDKRNMWKAETEKELPGYPQHYYNEAGEAFCYSEALGQRHRMIFVGYDKERDAQRFKCPVSHYGASCCESDSCNLCKHIRVPLKIDERIFTPVCRTGYKWKRIYKGRTAVERVNSRLDVSFGFEARRMRGQAKMDLLTTMALMVMNGIAVGRIKTGQSEKMRSLVGAA
jgi:hypothetical protein